MTKRPLFDPFSDTNKRRRVSPPLDEDVAGLILTYLAECELEKVEGAGPEYRKLVEDRNIWGVAAYNQFPKAAAELTKLNPPALPPGQKYHAHCGSFQNRRVGVTNWKEEFTAFADARNALSSNQVEVPPKDYYEAIKRRHSPSVFQHIEPREVTVLDFRTRSLRPYCGKLSTPVLQHIMLNCPNLRELYIEGYEAQSLDLDPHPSLEKIELRECNRLTQLNLVRCKAGLKTIELHDCTRLPWLDLTGFHQLETVVLNRCRSLGSIRLHDLRNIAQFTLNGSCCLRHLDTTGMRQLRMLKVVRCSGLRSIRFLPFVPMTFFSFGSNPVLERLDLTDPRFRDVIQFECDSDLVRGQRHHHTFPSGWVFMGSFAGGYNNEAWDICFAPSAEQRRNPQYQQLLTR